MLDLILQLSWFWWVHGFPKICAMMLSFLLAPVLAGRPDSHCPTRLHRARRLLRAARQPRRTFLPLGCTGRPGRGTVLRSVGLFIDKKPCKDE